VLLKGLTLGPADGEEVSVPEETLQDAIKRMLASGLGYMRDVFSNLIKP
jgi:hypothetical protein